MPRHPAQDCASTQLQLLSQHVRWTLSVRALISIGCFRSCARIVLLVCDAKLRVFGCVARMPTLRMPGIERKPELVVSERNSRGVLMKDFVTEPFLMETLVTSYVIDGLYASNFICLESAQVRGSSLVFLHFNLSYLTNISCHCLAVAHWL